MADHHAPVQHRLVTIRPEADWYTEEIREAKQERRKLEKHWRASGLTVDKLIFVDQCQAVQNLITTTQQQHNQKKIMDNANNPKVLHKIVNKLLNKTSDSPLPTHNSPEELAETFVDFFSDKISKIRNDLSSKHSQNTVPSDNVNPFDVPILSEFKEVTEEEVKKIILASPSKQCDLDPIPTWLVKECISPLLSIITKIVNLSLMSSTMPVNLKEALLNPLLKKASLDSETFKNFRPVSNLAYISKIVEKVVDNCTSDHMELHNLHDEFQSAYRKFHSTETALLRLHNDIMQAIDNKEAVALVLLDLSAAFDTVDHEILLD